MPIPQDEDVFTSLDGPSIIVDVYYHNFSLYEMHAKISLKKKKKDFFLHKSINKLWHINLVAIRLHYAVKYVKPLKFTNSNSFKTEKQKQKSAIKI